MTQFVVETPGLCADNLCAEPAVLKWIKESIYDPLHFLAHNSNP